MPEPRGAASRKRAVILRARGCCEYCLSQEAFSPDPFSMEHVVPRVRGGDDALSNLALSRQGCNNRKYDSVDGVDPATGEREALYHPRKDRWEEHFTWSTDQTMIVGVTAIGRATVKKLKLNREGLVNLRRALRATGEHPPREAPESGEAKTSPRSG
jgi:hypothetical protein